MIPYIVTPIGKIPTFVVMITIGILLFLLTIYLILKKGSNFEKETLYIFPKIIYSLLIASIFASFFDSLFKIKLNNEFVIQGATFYGGLLGGMITVYAMLFFSKEKTQYKIQEWFDILTLPLIIFHVCGRIGCFFAGCCYGKATNNIIGVAFPDNPTANIFHYGQHCYPTQLFEIISLIAIFIIVNMVKNKFKTYLVLYGISRFIIEFFRGDERGNLFGSLSPAQVISLIIITIIVTEKIFTKKHKKKTNRKK